MKPLALAFDIYGTLIDTAGVTTALQNLLKNQTQAEQFSTAWRTKQLEYTFRYAAMPHYRDFRACTRQALDHSCALLPPAAAKKFTPAVRADLIAHYLRLPAFPDVADGLRRLQTHSAQIFAFSNGHPDDLHQLLQNADLRPFFVDLISVHEIRTFKPAAAVYHHFIHRASKHINKTAKTNLPPAACTLISSNPFDICGARAVGMQAIWLRRNPATPFDPWEFTPTHQVATFADLVRLLTKPTPD